MGSLISKLLLPLLGLLGAVAGILGVRAGGKKLGRVEAEKERAEDANEKLTEAMEVEPVRGRDDASGKLRDPNSRI